MLIFYFLNLWYSDHTEEKDINLKRNDNEKFFCVAYIIALEAIRISLRVCHVDLSSNQYTYDIIIQVSDSNFCN